jgi:AcrR family transcriptional regulator
MPPADKSRRRYDATRRRELAGLRRQAILESSLRLFVERGYAGTTITAIAQDAGTAPETIYKAFGGKPGLVGAIVETGLLGSGELPAEARSDSAQATAVDSAALFRRFGELACEVAPRVAPVLRIIRDAAASGDDEMVRLLAEVSDQRRARMLHNAQNLRSRGFLREGITPERAADVMWTYTDTRLYDDLVAQRGWSLAEYGDFIAQALGAALSPQRASPSS